MSAAIAEPALTLSGRPPALSDADLHVLAVIFAEAHRHGRITDHDHDRTVVILGAARMHRDRFTALHMDRSIG